MKGSTVCGLGQATFVCAASATAAAPSVAGKGPDYWNITYYPTGADASSLKKSWYIVDAEGQTLGRLATLVASTIRCEDCLILNLPYSLQQTPSGDLCPMHILGVSWQ